MHKLFLKYESIVYRCTLKFACIFQIKIVGSCNLFLQVLGYMRVVIVYISYDSNHVPICRAEASIINHLRGYAPYLEKYKAVQFFSCRKIEIKRSGKFSIILFLEFNYYGFFNSKVGPNILPISRVCHNCSL